MDFTSIDGDPLRDTVAGRAHEQVVEVVRRALKHQRTTGISNSVRDDHWIVASSLPGFSKLAGTRWKYFFSAQPVRCSW